MMSTRQGNTAGGGRHRRWLSPVGAEALALVARLGVHAVVLLLVAQQQQQGKKEQDRLG